MKWGKISKNTSRTKSAVFSEDSRKILKFSITLIVLFHANPAKNAMKEFLCFRDICVRIVKIINKIMCNSLHK